MLTYFGQFTGTPLDDSSSVDGQIGWLPSAADWGTDFTCPGSGSVTLLELSAYVKVFAGTAPTMRLGIYTTAGVKIAESASVITVTGGSYSWQGSLTQASISPNPCTLSGGTSYKLAWYSLPIDGTTKLGIQYTNGTSGNSSYLTGGTTDPYAVGGLPTNLPVPEDTFTGRWWVRAGVNAAAGGGSVGTNSIIARSNVVLGGE